MPFFLHVWQADLSQEHCAWPSAEATLGSAEKARQACLRTPALRQTYGRAHGFLRAVLGQYLQQPASAVRVVPDATGKPALPGSGLHFNLSYRPGRALLAVSDTGAVGADVEAQQPLDDAQALIQQLFAPAEQAALLAAAPAAYWSLFFTIWTRKEAYAKALGMGLSMQFCEFSVLKLGADNSVALTAPAGATLHSFAAGTAHLGAVATLSAGNLPLAHFEFPAGLAQ
ncbi:4'-phosphopantetheinyl transferase family protein [Hymenobacter baengnokdamensis]|uniref:4'-phosphopantetheinyl transferase family protein n=1 Tax=Hymenobacter baengnokdamensis TaxID=2615203 RepID=UPI001244844D|nr:4'-phosphopantetheinyl transferase family protein [Hymenobacter baengnokdamensis]